MSEHIVVGVDGSEPSLLAVDWAAEAAARRATRLRVVHVLAPPGRSRLPRKSGAALNKRRRQHGEELVDRAVARAAAGIEQAAGGGAPLPQVAGAVRDGDAAEELLAEAAEAGTLVLGGRGLGGLAGMPLGSVGLQVASHADRPVVVVRGRAAGPGGIVAVGVDGSQRSVPAIRFACAEARLRGASLQAIHCWMFPADVWLPAVRPPAAELAEIEDAERRLLRDALDAGAADHPEVLVTEHLVPEHPVHALVNASARADLLVVGARGRGGFAGLAAGSVAHGVLHHADCPVAVVRAAAPAAR